MKSKKIICHYQTTVAMSLYLGLVLSLVSGETPCWSMAFLLLLLACANDCCCSFWGCFCSCTFSGISRLSCFSWFWSFNLVFIKWGLSLFKSDILTGFKKNSSAPSSKHLLQFHCLVRNFTSENIHKKKKNKGKTQISLPHYLLILEGTFSDDIITTGMFLKDEDSWNQRKSYKLWFSDWMSQHIIMIDS